MICVCDVYLYRCVYVVSLYGMCVCEVRVCSLCFVFVLCVCLCGVHVVYMCEVCGVYDVCTQRKGKR